MRFILAALLAVSCAAFAQPAAEKPPAKKAPKPTEEKAKAPPKPRVGIEKQGARGGDAPGQGGASSLGGTPGTPSGSFTR